MHTLLLLSAVLSTVSPALEARTPARLDEGPSLTLPGSQRRDLYLLETRFKEEGDEEGGAGHVIVELLLGVVGQVAGLALGLPVLSDDSPIALLAVPCLLGVLGSSAGVTFGGWALDVRGRFGSALLGGLIALAVPTLVGVTMLMATDCRSSVTFCGVLMPLSVGLAFLPPIGATIGYELSEPTPWLSIEYASRASPSAPRIFPMLAMTRQGLGITFGIAGSL